MILRKTIGAAPEAIAATALAEALLGEDAHTPDARARALLTHSYAVPGSKEVA